MSSDISSLRWHHHHHAHHHHHHHHHHTFHMHLLKCDNRSNLDLNPIMKVTNTPCFEEEVKSVCVGRTWWGQCRSANILKKKQQFLYLMHHQRLEKDERLDMARSFLDQPSHRRHGGGTGHGYSWEKNQPFFYHHKHLNHCKECFNLKTTAQ